MRRAFVLAIMVAPAIARAGWFGPSNWAECILDKMPGVQNDTAAGAVISQCTTRFPDTTVVSREYDSWGTCMTERGENVAPGLAERAVAAACANASTDKRTPSTQLPSNVTSRAHLPDGSINPFYQPFAPAR